MSSKAVLLTTVLLLLAVAAFSQDYPRWNFNIGGGIGFPLSTTSNFIGNAGHVEVGAGPNFSRHLGLSGEFMWHDLPIKRSVINALGVPSASAREYALTANAVIRSSGNRHLGMYAIGGGGWYHRSGEATAPALVPGTVCPAFWVWWGTCVTGLWPSNVVLASASDNALGGNIGGGMTYRLGESEAKFYTEIRYHHASHNKVDTDLLPLTFGLRW
jgi:hypothetical protein